MEHAVRASAAHNKLAEERNAVFGQHRMPRSAVLGEWEVDRAGVRVEVAAA
jgi:hypothetical protein